MKRWYRRPVAVAISLLVLIGLAGGGVLWRRRPPPLPDRPLRIGFLHDPPYMQWGPDGHAVGLSVEVISEAARRIHLGASAMSIGNFVIPPGQGAVWQMVPGRSAALKITSEMTRAS